MMLIKFFMAIIFIGCSAEASPNFLSETGLYQNIEKFEIIESVIEYKVRFPLYSGRYYKKRFIKLPQGTRIEGVELDSWVFPVGTKIWKEFGQKSKNLVRRIETRYMHKTEKGWSFLTYIWNDQGSDASLWGGSDGSTEIDLVLEKNKKYTVPSQKQCLFCHGVKAKSQVVLGFSSFQLKKDFLKSLIATGKLYMPSIIWDRHKIFSRTRLEEQAIGYLHGNCASCHNPKRKDVLSGSNFNIFYSLSETSSIEKVSLLSLLNTPYTNFGVPWNRHGASSYMISPGYPENSMLFYRMNRAPGDFKMPYEVKHKRDTLFIETVLEKWIKEL